MVKFLRMIPAGIYNQPMQADFPHLRKMIYSGKEIERFFAWRLYSDKKAENYLLGT
jgi:hypothetical protein